MILPASRAQTGISLECQNFELKGRKSGKLSLLLGKSAENIFEHAHRKCIKENVISKGNTVSVLLAGKFRKNIVFNSIYTHIIKLYFTIFNTFFIQNLKKHSICNSNIEAKMLIDSITHNISIFIIKNNKKFI